jgi:hypothetical protein
VVLESGVRYLGRLKGSAQEGKLEVVTFKCNRCGEAVVMIPAEDVAREGSRPGPYCEQCGALKSYEFASAETRPNLHCVETDDHDEDWFVVAHDEDEAEALHEGAEGYGDGHADATLAGEVPARLGANTGWPPLELLETCGGRIRRWEDIAHRQLAGTTRQSLRLLRDQANEPDALRSPVVGSAFEGSR